MQLLVVLLVFGASLALTLLIETPIIVRGGVTENKAYIRGVNTVTNVLLNLTLFALQCLEAAGSDGNVIETVSGVWFLAAELILIPVSESLLYLKLSSAGKKRVFFVTYLANVTSCLAGVLIGILLRDWM